MYRGRGLGGKDGRGMTGKGKGRGDGSERGWDLNRDEKKEEGLE